MELHDYNENILKLLKVSDISVNDIYYFDTSPYAELYDNFYQFCQEYLTNYCQDYNIEPAYFYFRDDMTINARAGVKNSTYIIAVNKATVYELYKLLYSNNHIIYESDTFTDYRKMKDFLDVPLEYLMFQLCTQFTFYHELAHLIQKSPYLSLGLNEQYRNDDYHFLKHLLEFDADLHGANRIGFHVINYWEKVNSNYKTKENFEKLLSASLASIFCYITLFFESFSNEIYYYEKSHPHALIRMTYIMATFVDAIKGYYPEIQQVNILKESIKISNTLFEELKKENLLGFYEKKLSNEYENISTYISELFRKAEQIPILVINKIHKQNNNLDLQ